MASAADFKITLYDASTVSDRVDWVGNPVSVTGTVRFGAAKGGAGSLTVVVNADDPVTQTLTTIRCRAVVEYKGRVLLTGRVKPPSGSFLPSGTTTFVIQDDKAMLEHTQAWVRPDNTLEAQSLSAGVDSEIGQAWQTRPAGANGTVRGQYGYFRFDPNTSSAESAIKEIVRTNFDRLGRPVVIKPDLGRGGNARSAGVLPRLRFGPVDEAIAPILTWSGLGYTLEQNPATGQIEFDVVVPRVWNQVLTPESGIIADGTWTMGDIAATRGVIGGPGQENARLFAGWQNGSLEADFAYVIEAFKDATGANLKWPDKLDETLKNAKYYLLRGDVDSDDKADFRAYIREAALENAQDGAPTNSLQVTLNETGAFQFGGDGGFWLGDLVTLEAHTGQRFYDQILEVAVSLNSKGEVKMTPSIGGKKDDPDRRFAESIKALARAQSRMSTRK